MTISGVHGLMEPIDTFILGPLLTPLWDKNILDEI